MPSSSEEWEEIAAKFERDWNFPNCIGALVGKHVVIRAPSHAGSVFYNYKGTHSIVLMAMCDAEYKFTYVDIGRNGRISDGGVFNQCSLAQAIRENQLNLPEPKPLPGCRKAIPYVILADDAFALQPHIIKPYPGHYLEEAKRVFNYRLSRGRRTIENAFGILSARFRVLRSIINLDPGRATKVVMACVVLHNFLLSRKSTVSTATNSVNRPNGSENDNCDDGDWRSGNFGNDLHSEPTEEDDITISSSGKEIRDEIQKYFMTIGAVPWQFERI